MKFAGIQKCSTIDFPGNLSCVLFVPGCDLDCFYCHNRALLDGSSPVLLQEEVEAFLQKRCGLLDGVVVSGGEPTLQQGLLEFLSYLKKLGYQTKLDTNGQRPHVVEELLQKGVVDYVAVDYKACGQDYGWVCEKSDGAKHVSETIRLLLHAGLPFEARTTLYPGLDAERLLCLARELPPLPTYRLNVFRMPERTRPQDALLFRGPALSAHEVEALLPTLRQVQPGAVC